MGRALLQSDRNALLLIDVLRTNVKAGRFRVHDFVVMPDHFHAVITVNPDMTIEKTMQLIKGWLFLSPQEGIRLRRRSLATRIFRGSRR